MTVVTDHMKSVHRACKILGIPRSIYYYQSRRDYQPVIKALQAHIGRHPTYGFPKAQAYIRRAGNSWNHKRVHRVYKLLKLNLRRKGKRRIPARIKQPLEQVNQPNEIWSIDFMQDSLLNGRKFRTFNAIDDFNCEVLAIEIDTSLPATRVIRTLSQVLELRGKPGKIRMDNGPEFISHKFELWCKEHQINLQYTQPGRPMHNGRVERFNGTYRRDILDAYLFEDLWQLKALTEEYVEEYNNERPHKALNNLTPKEYLLKYGQLTSHQVKPDLPTVQQDNNIVL